MSDNTIDKQIERFKEKLKFALGIGDTLSSIGDVEHFGWSEPLKGGGMGYGPTLSLNTKDGFHITFSRNHDTGKLVMNNISYSPKDKK